jgi:hypothetical protein
MQESCDQAELERLHLVLASSTAATAAYRELLIESLGDRMCGSGPGPTQDEIAAFSCLEEAQQRASENYVLFKNSLSLSEIDQGTAAMRALTRPIAAHVDSHPRARTIRQHAPSEDRS